MSEKQLLITINAEDKYCGKCYLKDIKSEDSCGIYYECILFDELVKSDYSFEKNERCRACLDAEKKAKEMNKEICKDIDCRYYHPDYLCNENIKKERIDI